MTTQKVSIYVVENGADPKRPRIVVTALTATDAVRIARGDLPDDDRWNVGRLGTYDPGINGASFMVDGLRPVNIVADEGVRAGAPIVVATKTTRCERIVETFGKRGYCTSVDGHVGECYDDNAEPAGVQ